MKLLEYEAKNILRSVSIAIPRAQLITPENTPELALPVVLKSQVPVGGRGKLGGVRIVDDKNDVAKTIAELFKHEIKGYLPTKILAEEKLAIKDEYYVSLVINRITSVIELVAHTRGGMEVEENNQASFLHYTLDGKNFDPAGEQLAECFDLPGKTFALQDLIEKLYHCFVKNDMTLLEINPLILTDDGRLVAGDGKAELDDAAAFRHPEWHFEGTLPDTNFVTLDKAGAIATIANGAGLAMATVDAVAAKGMKPANFLDIGGGANEASVLAAFERIMDFSHIEAIVINIFAGITRCDEVARAIIAAKSHISALPPLFLRLAGTNYEEAAALLAKEGITTLATLEACLDAAREVKHE